MVAMHEELARPRVLASLEDLAAGEASGVFEVAGNPSGAVYLDGGHIAYARASWVPGLAARLGARYPVLAVPPGQDVDDITIAGLAVQRGCLARAGLEEILRSIIIDAFLVLTVPLAADSPVTAMSFTSTRTYWTEMFPRLRLDSVRGEALRLGKRIAQYGLSATTRVTLCDLEGPTTVLTREQWAITCQLGDLRGGDLMSARDLAMRSGGALSETVESLGLLVRAGVCAPVRDGEDGSLPAATPSPMPSRAPSFLSSPSTAPLPAAVPGEREQVAAVPVTGELGLASGAPASEPVPEPAPAEPLPVRSPEPGLSGRVAGRGRPPTTEILRQVLSGLRKLS
jgi:hypothetical protein